MDDQLFPNREATIRQAPGRVPESRGAFSVPEWCRYRGICPATFYNRRRYDEMPVTVKVGRRTLITAESDAEWRLRMEQRTAPGIMPMGLPQPDEKALTAGRRSRSRSA